MENSAERRSKNEFPDLVTKMYKAEAKIVEKERELDEKNKKLEVAQQEIERLNVKRSTFFDLSSYSNFFLFLLFSLISTLLLSFFINYFGLIQAKDCGTNYAQELKILQRKVEDLTAEVNKQRVETKNNGTNYAQDKANGDVDAKKEIEGLIAEMNMIRLADTKQAAEMSQLQNKAEVQSNEINRPQNLINDQASGIKQLNLAANEKQKDFSTKLSNQANDLKHLQRKIEDLVSAMNKINSTISGLASEVKQLNLTVNEKFEDLSMKSNNIYSDLVMLLGSWKVFLNEPIRIYNSRQGNWSNCQLELPNSLAQHGATLLNNEIYIFGGYDRNLGTLGNCHKLSQDNKWIEVAAMNEKRYGIIRSSVVFKNEIWVFGGSNGVTELKSVEKYDPMTDIWTKMPDMIEKRNQAAASVIAGKIYVSGGWNGTNRLKSVEVYDPSKNQWKFFADMPFALDDHSSEVEDSHLIIIGGDRSNNEGSNEVWKIDVADPKKKWIKMPNLNAGRWGHGSIKLYNGLTVIGGSTMSTDIELFNGKSWIQKGADFGMVFRPALIPLTWKKESTFRQQLLCVN